MFPRPRRRPLAEPPSAPPPSRLPAPPRRPLRPPRATEQPSHSDARGPCVAIYIKRWSVASRSAETRASVAEGASEARDRDGETRRHRGGNGADGGREEERSPLSLVLRVSPLSRDVQRRKSSENTRIRNTASQCARGSRDKKDFLDPWVSIATPRCTSTRSHSARMHGTRACTRILDSNFPGYLGNF